MFETVTCCVRRRVRVQPPVELLGDLLTHTHIHTHTHTQPPVEPLGDRLIAFYSDELLHSVEPVSTPPLIREGASLRVHASGRFAISLWLPAPTCGDILSVNPAQEWLAALRERGEAEDPIGGTLFIEELDPKAAKAAGGGGGGGGGDGGGGAKTGGFGSAGGGSRAKNAVARKGAKKKGKK